jgi:hypothetical protein
MLNNLRKAFSSRRDDPLQRSLEFSQKTFEWLQQLDWKIGQISPYPISCDDQRELLAALRPLAPQKAVGFEKIRVGTGGDGAYVMLDDFHGIDHAISIGIGDNIEWDKGIVERGLRVKQYDGTIDGPPISHPLMEFHRHNLEASGKFSLAALANGAKPDSIILKLDIERGEWPVFDAIDEATLNTFSQIMCEFHDVGHLAQRDKRERIARVFAKLCRTHAVTHVHANNATPLFVIGNVPVPNVVEISFASRSRYTFTPSDELFPTPLDIASGVAPDIFLGSFRF